MIQAKRLLIALLSFAFTGILGAHDAHEMTGDVSPQVLVEQGLFHLVFYSGVSAGPTHDAPLLRVVYSPEGKVVIPRHQITGALLPKLQEQVSRITDKKTSDLPRVESAPSDLNAQPEPNTEAPTRLVLRELVQGTPHLQPLPLTIPHYSELADSWVGKTHVAVLWSEVDMTNPNDQKSRLHFGWLPRSEFVKPDTKVLGVTEQSFGSLTTSRLVWCDGRLWVAWVRMNMANGPGRIFEMVLTHYDPATNDITHKVLPGPCDWNSQVSVGATGGWLCVAWQCIFDAQAGGTSQIVTAFEKAPSKAAQKP